MLAQPYIIQRDQRDYVRSKYKGDDHQTRQYTEKRHDHVRDRHEELRAKQKRREDRLPNTRGQDQVEDHLKQEDNRAMRRYEDQKWLRDDHGVKHKRREEDRLHGTQGQDQADNGLERDTRRGGRTREERTSPSRVG